MADPAAGFIVAEIKIIFLHLFICQSFSMLLQQFLCFIDIALNIVYRIGYNMVVV